MFLQITEGCIASSSIRIFMSEILKIKRECRYEEAAKDWVIKVSENRKLFDMPTEK